MATLEDLKSSLILVLGDDPDEEPDYHEDLLADAINSGMVAILPRVWKQSTENIAAASTSHTIPSDCYEVQGVWDATQGMYLDIAIMAAGEPSATVSGNGWYEYPSGTLTFYKALGDQGGTLMYAASWAEVSDETDTIEAPPYSHYAIVLYAASYALLSKSTSAAKLAAYRTRVDSGTPEDNSLLQMAKYFRSRFDQELSQLPSMPRGVR